MRILYLVVLALFFINGCYDIVTNKYSTRVEAEQSALFTRGWLPNIIPQSASEIFTKNNDDANRSEGEFKFDVKELDEFIKQLSLYSNQKLPISSWQAILSTSKQNGYEIYEYINDQAIWIFIINNKTGHVQYMMWLQQKNN